MKTKNLIMVLTTISWLILFSNSTSLAVWGAATGKVSDSNHDAFCTWTSTLNPEPAIQVDDCLWLHHALDVQGFNQTNGWTIEYGAMFDGTIDITDYYAYVGNHKGGAVLNLSYTVGEGGFPPGDVHWIQVIRTTCPLAYKGAYVEADNDYYEYLDNNRNPRGNPFYDYAYDAGPTWFSDDPSRECGAAWCPRPPPYCTYCDWDAQVFMVVGDLTQKQLTICDRGVQWGFEYKCVPVPATVVLLGFGGLALLRKRRA